MKSKNKTLKIISSSIITLAMLLTYIQPANAMILFMDDVFQNNSETFQIGSDDDSTATTLSLEFGGTNTESIVWDTSQFNLSDDLSLGQSQLKDVAIDNLATAPATPTSGQIYHNTTNNNTYIWNGSAWEDITAGAGSVTDFEDVYIEDADKTLTTTNGDFTVNTGTGDFIVNSNDWDVDASGNISTIGAADFSGASRMALDQGASNPANCTEGDIFYNTTNDKTYTCTATDTWTEIGEGASGGDADTLDTLDSTQFIRADATDTYGDGGAYNLSFGSDDVLQVDGTFDANGVVQLGDGGDNINIDSSVWDISSAGVASGFTGITSTGTVDFSGASRMALYQGASNPATCTEGDIFYNTTDNKAYLCTDINTWTDLEDTDADTLDTLDSTQFLRNDVSDTFGIGGAHTLMIGSDDVLQVDGTFDANGVVAIGDNGDNVTIDSSTWDISSTGVGSGFTGFTSSGTVDFNASSSFRLHESTVDPATCTEGQLYYNTADNKLRFCYDLNSWTDVSPDVVTELSDGGAVPCGTADTTILTHNSSIDGASVLNIQVNVHLKNTGGATATIAAGNLKLKRNGTEIYMNNQEIEVGSSQKGENPGYSFAYRDSSPGDSPSYTVTCAASAADEISGDADLYLDNGSGGGAGAGGGGGEHDFETVFATDGDDTLTTSNVPFTINTGISNFIVDSNDWTVDASGNLTIKNITSTGAVDFSGVSRLTLHQGPSNPATCTEGDIFYNTVANEAYVCTATDVWTEVGGTDADTLDSLDSLQFLRADATDTYGDGGIYTLTVGGDDTLDVDGTLRADGAFDANGVVTIGDNGDNVTIDSSVWDISSAGVASGFTGITSTGTVDFSGASRLALYQGTSNPSTCTEGDIFYNTTDNKTYVCTATNIWSEIGGTDADTLDTLDSLQFIRADATDSYGDGGIYTLTIGSDDTLQVDGTLDANGTIILGDGNGDTVTVDSSTWDISSAGVVSGLTGITSSGTANFSGTSSFRIQEGTSDPASCTEGQLYYNIATNKLRFCSDTDTWEDVSPTVITERADNGAVACGTSDTIILTHNSAIDGASVLNIQVNVHLKNTGGTTATIAAGNLKLKRNGTAIYTSDQEIEVGSSQKGENPSYSFSYRDTSPGDSPSYTVTCAASSADEISGDADLLLDNGAGGGAGGGAGSGDDFETVYANDSGNNLVTGNGIFTIDTGTNNFVVDSNDWSVDASGNLSTSGAADFSGASRLALDQGSSNPLTCTEGDIFYNTTDDKTYICTATDTWTLAGCGSDADTLDTLDSLQFLRSDATDTYGDGGIYTLTIGSDDTLQVDGTLDVNGVVTLGDNSYTVAIDSSDWDINTAGDMTGIGAINMDGNLTQAGATDFSTGTGTVSLNGATTVTNGNSFAANGNVNLGDNGDTVAIDSTSWDISSAGIGSGFTGFTSTGIINFSGASRMALHQGAANPGTCSEGDIFYNTTDNNTYICVSDNAWTAVSDFEGTYNQDADKTLTTSNGNFTVNTGTGDFVVTSNDWGVDANGKLGIGTNSPAFDLHLYDTFSTIANEWQVFDDGANQVSILTGTQDPTSVATDADIGSIFLNTNTGNIYLKTDDGLTTNWNESGLNDDLNDALKGTYGTPSGTNKFVTDTDPRLQATTGTFGETALGSRLNYGNYNLVIDSNNIFYSRIFLPADTIVNSMGVYTAQAKTIDINLGIYSDDNGPDNLLAQTGTQSAVTTAAFGFNSFDLTSPLVIDDAGYYWAALALGSEQPKGATLSDADDRFMPYRIQSKAAGSTNLPATATPSALGNIKNLPYFAAFE